MEAAAPKSFGLAGRTSYPSGVITVPLQHLLCNACIGLAPGKVELLTTLLLQPTNVPNICQVVLGFDKGIQHVDEN
jgi:hypothetical protein